MRPASAGRGAGGAAGRWLPALVLLSVLVPAGMEEEPAPAPFPVISTVDAANIAGRPVALDRAGRLLPWPMPDDTGYSYSSYFLSRWTVLWDQYNRQRLPYYYCCYGIDRTSFELVPDPNWVNSTGYLRAMMEGFIEHLYPYTGDRRTLTFLESLVDYELENGLTPAEYAWPGVPYASADPGARRYSGWSHMGRDYLEPHVVGEDGYGYLRLYEMSGERRYLEAAIRCADALVRNLQPGSESVSPWPVRVYARDGRTDPKAFGTYSSNVIEPIMLFDELIRLGQGNSGAYRRVRAAAWSWFLRYPVAGNVWVGYFEDTVSRMENMNQVIPLEFARYVLLHPEKDPEWREHARRAIEWVRTTPKWPKYVVHGATVTTEQGDGVQFCCNEPNQCCDSHTSRLAAVEALYYARTGDAAYRDEAYRSYNWVTYFAGLPARAHPPFVDQWWFTDQYADGPRRLMDGLWAVPEWAPGGESHLLGSTSVVNRIRYGRGSVAYSTFDRDATDVLRLDFAPRTVTAGGRPLARRGDLERPGFTFDDRTRVLRVRHQSAGEVEIEGEGGEAPPEYVDFDNPHLAGGTALSGTYPSGTIDWGSGGWTIHVPDGGFGTFNLALTNPAAPGASLRLPAPRIFKGIDVSNSAPGAASLVLRSPGLADVPVTVGPGEVRRIRTGWTRPGSEVRLEVTNGGGLRFDNLAYQER